MAAGGWFSGRKPWRLLVGGAARTEPYKSTSALLRRHFPGRGDGRQTTLWWLVEQYSVGEGPNGVRLPRGYAENRRSDRHSQCLARRIDADDDAVGRHSL